MERLQVSCGNTPAVTGRSGSSKPSSRSSSPARIAFPLAATTPSQPATPAVPSCANSGQTLIQKRSTDSQNQTSSTAGHKPRKKSPVPGRKTEKEAKSETKNEKAHAEEQHSIQANAAANAAQQTVLAPVVSNSISTNGKSGASGGAETGGGVESSNHAPSHWSSTCSTPRAGHPPGIEDYTPFTPSIGLTHQSSLDETDLVDNPSGTTLATGGVTDCGDEPDGSSGQDLARLRLAMESIQLKISKTRERIKAEQTARDDNVNEYLRLTTNADKGQQSRLKAMFEKKNAKSAQAIVQLQKKLETYQRKLKETEANGLTGPRPPRQMLRDVGMGLKTVMSKPREFAHLIRNKFGSADNINAITRNGEPVVEENMATNNERPQLHGGSSSLPGHANAGSALGTSNSLPGHGKTGTLPSQGSGGGGQGSGGKYTSEEGSECGSSVTSESVAGGIPLSPRHLQGSGLGLMNMGQGNLGNFLGMGLESLFLELQDRREEVERLREEMEAQKQSFQQEVQYLTSALQEERFRLERLEEQINDLTELHQNEVENLRQGVTDMEEKVQYQSEERLRDIHDLLDACQTRISKMEHQQQHQQYVTLEGIENSNARAVLVKLINMVLTILQLLLVLVSTAVGVMAPFLKTRFRTLSTVILVFVIAFVFKQWPELKDLGSHVIRHYKQALASS